MSTPPPGSQSPQMLSNISPAGGFLPVIPADPLAAAPAAEAGSFSPKADPMSALESAGLGSASPLSALGSATRTTPSFNSRRRQPRREAKTQANITTAAALAPPPPRRRTSQSKPSKTETADRPASLPLTDFRGPLTEADREFECLRLPPRVPALQAWTPQQAADSSIDRVFLRLAPPGTFVEAHIAP